MTDWASISALATAGGTLVLALATFASVRSANRAARTAERALLAGLRPVLTPSSLEDSPIKVYFADNHWVRAPGGGAVAEATDQAIYLAISLRNAGSGIAVLHGWMLYPERRYSDTPHAELREFRRLTRDIYVSPGIVGFWQGAFRDPGEPAFRTVREAIEAREGMTVDILYGDQEGGQRMISRFGLMPRDDGYWMAAVGRHWNVDRADPR
jgi:hypothetical protein